MTTADAAAIVEAISRLEARIVARLDRLEQAVARPRPRLARADLAILEKLLPAIVAAVGSAEFIAADLLEEFAGPKVVVGHLSPRQIGKLLARSSGIPINGLQVERLGVIGGICSWRVVAVDEVSSGF